MAMTLLKTESIKFKAEREDNFFIENIQLNIAFLVIVN